MASEDLVRRADLARQVFDNQAFNEAVQALHESIRRQRLAVKASDADGQLRLIIAEQLLDKLIGCLHRYIEDGKQEEIQLVKPPLLQRVFAR